MSTLAAARADNFYYPPEWDPKKGGLNKQQGQHPLRDRARKLDQGILIIRFEMPFNVWCEGCNHLIGKGVRFNAEKKQIGNYFSTKIWSFVMRSPCCQTRIEVQTDPKNAEYVVVSGGRQKVEAFSAQDAETLELPDQEDKAKYDDPLYKLERGQEDKRKAIDNASRIEALYADSLVKSKNDYAMNKALRKTMRAARKAEKARDARREELGLPEIVRLLPETAADIDRAALVAFGDPNAHDKARRLHRQAIKSQSIFATPASKSALALPASALPRRDAHSFPHPARSTTQRPLDPRGGTHAAASHSAVCNEGQRHASGAFSPSAGHDWGQHGASGAGPSEEGGARVGCFGGGVQLLKTAKAAGRTGLAALGIKSGAVKKRTIAEKAALELKRRRMASGLTLGFTAPETVARPGPTYVMKR